MRLAPPLLFIALVALPPAAWPQGTPLGPEFQVNTYTTGNQFARGRSIATDSSGNVVVVWQSEDRTDRAMGSLDSATPRSSRSS
jgi:hypothetical protein